MFGIVSGQLTGNYHRYREKFSRIHDFSLARLIRRLATLADMGMYGFGFKKNRHSSEKYANFIHRHRVIFFFGGGGGGVLIDIQTKTAAACVFILSSRSRPSLTGLVPGRGAEPRQRLKSLQIDLVLSDVAATSEL